MNKSLRDVAMKLGDLDWLVKLTVFPVEVLDAVIGIILGDRFIVVGGHNLSINAPVNWFGHEEILNAFKPGELHDNRRNITLPMKEGKWDYEQIAPFSGEVSLSVEAEKFLVRWVGLLEDEWEGEIPVSLAFLHNHPVARPEYLSPKALDEYESAYDLSGSTEPFHEWLKKLGQEPKLSSSDVRFLKRRSTDGIGILVLGAEVDDLACVSYKVGPFIKAWQISRGGVKPLTMSAYDPTKIDRDFANFLYTCSSVVERMAEKARAETSFWPSFAAPTKDSLRSSLAE